MCGVGNEPASCLVLAGAPGRLPGDVTAAAGSSGRWPGGFLACWAAARLVGAQHATWAGDVLQCQSCLEIVPQHPLLSAVMDGAVVASAHADTESMVRDGEDILPLFLLPGMQI